MIQIHKCEQCDDVRFHGGEFCERHTKRLCVECRNGFFVSEMTRLSDTMWMVCRGCLAESQRMNAGENTATSEETKPALCSIEGCGKGVIFAGGKVHPYCEAHEEKYKAEWFFCGVYGDGTCWRWCEHATRGDSRCSLHGGTDYTPRTREEGESRATTATEITHRCKDDIRYSGTGCEACELESRATAEQSKIDQFLHEHGAELAEGVEAAAALQVWLWSMHAPCLCLVCGKVLTCIECGKPRDAGSKDWCSYSCMKILLQRWREESTAISSPTTDPTPCIVCGVPVSATTRDAEPWAFEGERGRREGMAHSGCRSFVEERRGQG